MIHVIVEIICLFKQHENAPIPSFCKYGPKKEGFHCLIGNEHKLCSYIGFCEAEHEIAYSQEEGEIKREEEWIGFGGEMEIENYDRNALIELWHNICLTKIEEAYEEYINQIEKLKQERITCIGK
ncbi:MAG: hypothetical protein VSS75_018570 [Candidatus Parabeggiatoa sp.]|nr:hypothetical protein [Candidatus Parabeggiatoa sp.]